ncbi:unnamed protein product [Moneuplotes crassus]|uniref:RanBP2-type domain-containing protein n=1 Tax=Euplotes crassus TaxID=5936 RepID=A0AAD2DC87_EUPCR|nr:unnamed protein product [Moneuplotes crassus]
MQGDTTMEDMRNNLKSVVTSNLPKPSTRDKNVGREILAILDIFINTKITNSFLILISCKNSVKDSDLMKSFKMIIKNTKELSYIQNRHIHVTAALDSPETRRVEKFDLEKKLKKLGRLKSKLEDDIYQSFLTFADLLNENTKDPGGKYTNFLPYCCQFLLEALNSECVSTPSKEERKEGSWVSPYSEISKMARFSFEVEFQTIKGPKIAQLDLPLVYRMDVNEMVRRPFTDILKDHIGKHVLDSLVNQGISRDCCDDLSLRIVNQPEIFIVEFEGFSEDDKTSISSTSNFYKPRAEFASSKQNLDLFCKIMKKNEFTLSDLFKIRKDDKIVKEYYPKHVVLWNTAYECSEVYTLQAFRYEDERGKQCVQGFFSGTYNLKEDVQDFSDLFEEIKYRDVYPTLIIFECYETHKCEVEESQTSGTQFVRIIKPQSIENKYTYEGKDDDDFDYYEWMQESRREAGSSHNGPKDDEWQCEYCTKINTMSSYYCYNCLKDNEIIRELIYQKRYYKNRSPPKYESREVRPVRARRELNTDISNEESELVNTFKPKERFNLLKDKWICRHCNIENSYLVSLCEKCYKAKQKCDLEEPHCQNCKKSLRKKTLPKCKDCRESRAVDPKRMSKERQYKNLETHKSGSLSFMCYPCRNKYRRNEWIPMSKSYCPKCYDKKIYMIKCNLCNQTAAKSSELIGHDCIRRETRGLHEPSMIKRNTYVGPMIGGRF